MYPDILNPTFRDYFVNNLGNQKLIHFNFYKNCNLHTMNERTNGLHWGDQRLTDDEMDQRLSDLSDEDCAKIDRVLLYGNRLTRIPKCIFQRFTHISLLSVRHNHITFVPAAITKLTNLKTLYMRNNEIHTLPSTMTSLTLLKQLNTTSNPALPRSLQVWTDCTEFALNKIGVYFGEMEKRHNACRKVCIAMLSLRRKSKFIYMCCNKDMINIVAKMILETRRDDRWTNSKSRDYNSKLFKTISDGTCDTLSFNE